MCLAGAILRAGRQARESSSIECAVLSGIRYGVVRRQVQTEARVCTSNGSGGAKSFDIRP